MKAFLTAILVFVGLVNYAQVDTTKEFLPKTRLFELPYLDPNEALAYGSFAFWWDKQELVQKAYVPISFGFYKPVMRWNKKRPVEFGIDAAAHFQFEWLISDSIVQRNLLNADYKFSFNLAWQLSERHFLRLRAYHVSSHLGDDYLIRNGVTSYVPNSNNYEQLDVLWARQGVVFRNYVGMGLVIRPETIRKRFSTILGSTFDLPFEYKPTRAWAGGIHLRILEENDFRPGVKLAMGLRLGEIKQQPFRFMIEYFSGNLPFSAFERNRITWMGIGLSFAP